MGNAAEVLTAAANAARAAAQAAHDEQLLGVREEPHRHSVPELRRKTTCEEPRRSVDLSRNKSLNLRRSTSGSNGSNRSSKNVSPLNTLTQHPGPQGAAGAQEDAQSDEMTTKSYV